MEVFFTVADVREKLERWRNDYNEVRPHSALNDQSPQTFATTWAPSVASASIPWPANYTLAGVARSAAAANPDPRQLFVRPSVEEGRGRKAGNGSTPRSRTILEFYERFSLELSELSNRR